MSRDYKDICNKILQSNQDIYNGPTIILQEFEIIKKDIKRLSDKIDQIHRLIIRLNHREDY